MTTDTRIALAGLALCDALDDGLTDAGTRQTAIETARRHYHAIIEAEHGITAHRLCVCPDEARGDCDCTEDCICAAMAQGEKQ